MEILLSLGLFLLVGVLGLALGWLLQSLEKSELEKESIERQKPRPDFDNDARLAKLSARVAQLEKDIAIIRQRLALIIDRLEAAEGLAHGHHGMRPELPEHKQEPADPAGVA